MATPRPEARRNGELLAIRRPKPVLSEFVRPRRDAAAAEVRAALGLGRREWVAWRLERDGAGANADAWRIILTFGDPASPHMVVDVWERRADRRGWHEGERLTVSYRTADGGDDPWTVPALRTRLTRLRERFAALDARPDELRAALTHLRHHTALAEVEDWVYCQVSPREAVVRLGFQCNQRCRPCWQSREWPAPPRELVLTWVDELAAAGVPSVSFSGGEPTLYHALPELVRHARARGLRVTLQTNAVTLAEPGRAEELRSAGVNELFVSWHSDDAAVSDALTAVPGSHGKTARGIEAALQAGLEVVLNCVVERANCAALPEHAAGVVSRFVTPFPAGGVSRVEYSYPCPYRDRHEWVTAAVPLATLREPLIAAARTLLAADVEVGGVGTCGFPPCLFRDEPDVAPALLRWHDPREEHPMDTAARAYAPACGGCAARTRCLGLRREHVEAGETAGVRPFATLPGPPPQPRRSLLARLLRRAR